MTKIHTGGCLCGALRYEARGEPDMAGHCYCADCRKASGSGFIPFMNFSASALTISGRDLCGWSPRLGRSSGGPHRF